MMWIQELIQRLIPSLAQHTEAVNSKIMQGIEGDLPIYCLFTCAKEINVMHLDLTDKPLLYISKDVWDAVGSCRLIQDCGPSEKICCSLFG